GVESFLLQRRLTLREFLWKWKVDERIASRGSKILNLSLNSNGLGIDCKGIDNPAYFLRSPPLQLVESSPVRERREGITLKREQRVAQPGRDGLEPLDCLTFLQCSDTSYAVLLLPLGQLPLLPNDIADLLAGSLDRCRSVRCGDPSAGRVVR